MTPKVIRDPQDPGFPHGTLVGYSRGCNKTYSQTYHPCPAEPTCFEVKFLGMRLREAEGRPQLFRPTALTAYVKELRESGWDYEPIASAAGLRVERLLRIINKDIPVTLGVIRSVLSLDNEIIARRNKPKARAPFRLARGKLRAMYANGYTVHRMSHELQADRAWLWKTMVGPERRFVLCSLYVRISAMYEVYGRTSAPFSSGAEHARRDARLRGWVTDEALGEVAA